MGNITENKKSLVEKSYVDKYIKKTQELIDKYNKKNSLPDYKFDIYEMCKRIGLNFSTLMKLICSLGSGNHYIEINEDIETNEQYLTVHSGSRRLGLNIVKYYSNCPASFSALITKQPP